MTACLLRGGPIGLVNGGRARAWRVLHGLRRRGRRSGKGFAVAGPGGPGRAGEGEVGFAAVAGHREGAVGSPCKGSTLEASRSTRARRAPVGWSGGCWDQGRRWAAAGTRQKGAAFGISFEGGSQVRSTDSSEGVSLSELVVWAGGLKRALLALSGLRSVLAVKLAPRGTWTISGPLGQANHQ